MTAQTRIACPLDFDKAGRQVGHLRLPHSSNISAYGWIGIPIAVIKNGSGPTVYLGGGNHGDEYEGQISLVRLIQELDPARIQGRLIILPATNLPAAMNHSRCSPIDGGNLNRSFPGEANAPDNRPTAAIAHYVEEVLLPMCDAMLDMHSGGKTLDYVPSGLIRRDGPDDPLFARKLEALKAYGAPIGYVVEGGGMPAAGGGIAAATITCAADRKGVLGMGTELGGAGTVTLDTLGVARRGIENFLAFMGVMEKPATADSPKSRLLKVAGPDYYVHAPCRGAFEPAFRLGDEVEAGQVCGWIHQIDEPDQPSREVRFERAGVAFCKRPITAVERGDCLAHLGTDWQG
ncbi:MAG: succinylglutamate desuccinylase/aspartoacylase family protein [Geminicoccaceae bacterium]